MTFYISRFALLMLLFAAVLSGVIAKDPPPPGKQMVNDFANVLSPDQLNALENKLRAYNDSTSTQIAIVIENSLEGDDIFDYSLRLATQWGIGGGSNNNGVLIYVALDDRKLRIQTGYGVEGFLTDALAKRIIETKLKPAFREQRYYEGLSDAVDVIAAAGRGEYKAEDQAGKVAPAMLLLGLLVFVFLMWIIFSWINRNRGYSKKGSYTDTHSSGGGWWWFPGGGWGSGSGGSSWGGGSDGGSDFGGWGGGDFGGGGSGGDW